MKKLMKHAALSGSFYGSHLQKLHFTLPLDICEASDSMETTITTISANTDTGKPNSLLIQPMGRNSEAVKMKPLFPSSKSHKNLQAGKR